MGADRAIGVEGAFPTRMLALCLDRDTIITAITMVIINAQPLAHPTDTTSFTVVSMLARGIIIKLANLAKIPRKLVMTRTTLIRHGLVMVAAAHTRDELGGVAVDLMVLRGVVAAAAGVVAVATIGADPAVPPVVVAAGGGALAGEGGAVGGGRALRDVALAGLRKDGLDAALARAGRALRGDGLADALL